MVHVAIHGYSKFMLGDAGEVYKVMMSLLLLLVSCVPSHVWFYQYKAEVFLLFVVCIKENQQSLWIAMKHMYNMPFKKRAESNSKLWSPWEEETWCWSAVDQLFTSDMCHVFGSWRNNPKLLKVTSWVCVSKLCRSPPPWDSFHYNEETLTFLKEQ